MSGLEKRVLLLSVGGRAEREMDKTNSEFAFDVSGDFDSLVLEFSYAPKKVGDREDSLRQIEEAMKRYAPPPYAKSYGRAEDYLPLDNLLTVSLYSPEGFVGCAHRHANEQSHTISAERSDYGFRPARIVGGRWIVELNAHCVAAPCDYRIAVYGIAEAGR